NLATTVGSITVGGAGITATTGDSTLNAATSIGGAGTVSGDTVDLTSNLGDIGSLVTPLSTSANTFTFSADGSAYLSNNKSVSATGTAGTDVNLATTVGSI